METQVSKSLGVVVVILASACQQVGEPSQPTLTPAPTTGMRTTPTQLFVTPTVASSVTDVPPTPASPIMPRLDLAPMFTWGRGRIDAAAWSQDGDLLALSSSSGTIFLYDAVTLQEKFTIDTRTRGSTVAIHPDGERVAALAPDAVVGLWDIHTGELLRSIGDPNLLRGPFGEYFGLGAAAFSPDGRRLAVGIHYGVVIWDLETDEFVPIHSPLPEFIFDLAFNPDGDLLAVSGSRGEGDALTVLEIPAGEVAFSSCTETEFGFLPCLPYSGVAFHPGGLTLAAGGSEGLEIWDIPSGQRLRTIGRGSTGEVAYSPDGLRLMVETGNALWVLDVQEGEYIGSIRTGGSLGALRPDGRAFVSIHDDHAKLWIVSTGELVGTIAGYSGLLSSLATHPNTGTLAVAGLRGQVWLVDPSTGGSQSLLREGAGHILAYSTDGGLLAAAGDDGILRLFDGDRGSLTRTIRYRTCTGIGQDYETLACILAGLAFSFDGKLLAIGTTLGSHEDPWIQVVDPEAGMILYSIEDNSSQFALSHSSPVIAYASGNIVKILDLLTGEMLTSFSTGADSPSAIGLSPDGEVLATTENTFNTVQLWNISAQSHLHTLRGHTDCVTYLEFSPDGKLLATAGGGCAGADPIVLLWDVEVGDLLASLDTHSEAVRGLAFSSDGSALAVGSFGGRVTVWSITRP